MNKIYVDDESGNIRAYLQTAAELTLSAASKQEEVEIEKLRPFMLLRPKVFPDGDQWCALYGDNLQEGVTAFGITPAQAAIQFDIERLNAKP